MIKLKRSLNKILKHVNTSALTKLLLYNEKLFNVTTSTHSLQIDDSKLFFTYIEDAEDILSNIFSDLKNLYLTAQETEITDIIRDYADLSSLSEIIFQGNHVYFQMLLQEVIFTQTRFDDEQYLTSISCRFYNADAEKISQCLFIPSIAYRKQVERLSINFTLSKYAKHALNTYSGLKQITLTITDDNNHVVDLPFSENMEKFTLVKQLINTFEIIDIYTSYPNLMFFSISCSIVQHINLNFSKQVTQQQLSSNRLNQDIQFKKNKVIQIMQQKGCLEIFKFFSISEIPVDLFILMTSNQPKIQEILISSQLVQSNYTVQNFEKLQNWLNPDVFNKIIQIYKYDKFKATENQQEYRVDDVIFDINHFNEEYILQQKATNLKDQVQKTQWNIPSRSSFVIDESNIDHYLYQQHDSIFHRSIKSMGKPRTNSHTLMYEKMMLLAANQNNSSNTDLESESEFYSSSFNSSLYSESSSSSLVSQSIKYGRRKISQTNLKQVKQTPVLDDNQVQTVRRSSFIQDNQDILTNWTMDTNIEIPVSESFVSYTKPTLYQQIDQSIIKKSYTENGISLDQYISGTELQDDSLIQEEPQHFAHDDTRYYQKKNKKILKRSWSSIQFFSIEKTKQHFIFQKGVSQFINVYLRNEKQSIIRSLYLQLPFCKFSEINQTKAIFKKLLDNQCIRQDKREKYCQKSVKQLKELINEQDIFFNTTQIDEDFEFSMVQDFTYDERQHTLRDEKQEFKDQYFTFDTFQQQLFNNFYDKQTMDPMRVQNSILNENNKQERHMSIIPNAHVQNFLSMNLPEKMFGITLNKHKFQLKNDEQDEIAIQEIEQNTTAVHISIILFVIAIPQGTKKLILLQVLFTEFTFNFLINHLSCLEELELQELPLLSNATTSSQSIQKLTLLDQGYLSIQILDSLFPCLNDFFGGNIFLDNDIIHTMNLQFISISQSKNLSKKALQQFIQGNQFTLQSLSLDNCPIPFIQCQMNKLETLNCKNIIYSYSEYYINNLSLGHLDFLQLIIQSPNMQTACYNQITQQYQGVFDYQNQFNVINTHYCSQMVSVIVDSPLVQVIKKFVSRECFIQIME
ncbi:hypothetical protein SS50377_20230 [Spironucleus salmonicida]|uniref:Uncharacterized protein n=1 Tax=Spironucleus salmonicida TaxID=348837 RepID=V6LNI7_9EUKA|nr:hypothetical protein SS50377_20230 [Spironucleus salmonicida]|eukprot:EST45286.1 Hypothetical protein SS50377_14862 [Spironucleus salmonicida]